MTDSYEPRAWGVETVALDQAKTIPLSIGPFSVSQIVSIDSLDGENLRARGVTPFYFDIEQLEAGLDRIYGVSSVRQLSSDYQAPSGTLYKKGALVYQITDIDFDASTRTILFEKPALTGQQKD